MTVVIETLHLTRDQASDDAFDKDAAQLVVVACALLAPEYGPARSEKLFALIDAVYEIGDKRADELVH